jgi:2,4-dienoyl-CoA reductase-like NADH-dependent reductase (Old Yellow Enzyme family)
MILNKLNFKNKKYKLSNRISVSPMCQYSGRNGLPTSWHYRHLSNLLLSGAGLLMIESTAISENGKISIKDLCIETSKQKNEFKKLINYLKKINNTPIGIQLSHSGRKGSSHIPWEKKNSALKNKMSWKTISSSSIPKDKGWPKPKMMNEKDIAQLKKKFENAAKNSNYANFDFLELHIAHGYLLHQFLSPISNKRKDSYGSSKLNRFKLPLEIARITRKVWPKDKILGARITASDHLPKGISLKESIDFCKKLEKIGFDYVCVSSGGIITKTKLKFKNFFRINFAEKIKKKTKLKVGITGMTNNFQIADRYLKKKNIDFLFVGRPFLSNPFFLFKDKYLIKNGFKKTIPQYIRGI